MLVYLIRRLGQSLLAVAAMAVLVFVGVYAIGNPVDILISPEATEVDREAPSPGSASTSRSGSSSSSSSAMSLHGDLGNSFVYGTPAMTLILQRLPATLELALVALAISVLRRRAARGASRAQARERGRPLDHGRLDPGLLAAQFLAGHDADPDLRRDARLAAGGRARRRRSRCWACRSASSPRDGLAHLILPAHQPRAVQDVAGDPPRPRRRPARSCCRTT